MYGKNDLPGGLRHTANITQSVFLNVDGISRWESAKKLHYQETFNQWPGSFLPMAWKNVSPTDGFDKLWSGIESQSDCLRGAEAS